MITSIVSGIADLRKAATGLTWLGWAIAGGCAAAAVAVVWIGAHDARVADRARAAANTRCEADRLAVATAAERAKAEAFRRAAQAMAAEIARRGADQQTSAARIARLEQEKGDIRAELDALQDARDIALPDDRWLRQGRPAGAGRDAAGR